MNIKNSKISGLVGKALSISSESFTGGHAEGADQHVLDWGYNSVGIGTEEFAGHERTTNIISNVIDSLTSSSLITNASAGKTSGFISNENWDDYRRNTVETGVKSFYNDVLRMMNDKEINTGNENFNENVAIDALSVAVAVSDPYSFFKQTSNESFTQDTIGFGNLPEGESHYGRLSVASEAFDNQEIRNTMAFSFTYGFTALRQDAFGEAFFPTITVAPDVATVTISVDLLNVMNDVRHNLSGDVRNQWDRKTLISALVYPDILQNDTTKNIPVYREENKKHFVDESLVAPETITILTGMGREKVRTSWLKTNTRMNLISLGATETLVGGGSSLNFTDNLDTSIVLTDLLLKVDDQLVALSNLQLAPEATFVYPVQGNDRVVRLNYNNDFIYLSPNTKTITGAPFETPASRVGYSVRLSVSASGDINVEVGDTRIMATSHGVTDVFNARGDRIALDEGTGESIVEYFSKAEIIGWKQESRRINTNRRERGQLLDINRENMVYGLPILAPISIVRPVQETTAKDAARIDALIAATYVRCSNAAVAMLLQADKQLSTLPPIEDPELVYNSKMLGAARYFLKPYYNVIDLDVAKQVNSLRSADRIADVGSVLLNAIRELVFDAYLQSNYKAAADALNGTAPGSNSAKPKVIIGTDPKIASYLQLIGDSRNLGDQFEYEVVATANMNMRGKCFIAFGKKGNSGNDMANPLHFGNMVWRPEMTTVLPISRHGTITREMTVQPSFRHILHSPILMRINIENLSSAIVEAQPLQVDVKSSPVLTTRTLEQAKAAAEKAKQKQP